MYRCNHPDLGPSQKCVDLLGAFRLLQYRICPLWRCEYCGHKRRVFRPRKCLHCKRVGQMIIVEEQPENDALHTIQKRVNGKWRPVPVAEYVRLGNRLGWFGVALKIDEEREVGE